MDKGNAHFEDAALLGELYKKICNNDQQAFKQLYRLTYRSLLEFSDSFTRRRVLSEEIIGDVFTNFWLNRSRQSIENVFTFLYVSVRNKSLDYIKKEAKYNYFIDDEEIVSFSVSASTPESVCITKEEIFRIEKIVNSLPERCRTALVLSKYNHLKYKEIAEIMGISERTVENQVATALVKITAQLNPSSPHKERRLSDDNLAFILFLCLMTH